MQWIVNSVYFSLLSTHYSETPLFFHPLSWEQKIKKGGAAAVRFDGCPNSLRQFISLEENANRPIERINRNIDISNPFSKSKFSKATTMYVIDLTFKNSPVTVSGEYKAEEDAKSVYQKVSEAIQSGQPNVIEVSCEQPVKKVVSVVVSEIAAVQMTEKSGTTTASGKPPGFFAVSSSSNNP